jgi:alpha-tubulin suppressor-like RCC1 family protein
VRPQLFAWLALAVGAAASRLGLPLPAARHAGESLTHRLHFLQRLVTRRPETLSAGTGSSLCLCDSGALLFFGSSGSDEDVVSPIPTPVSGLQGVHVREVAAGDTHCLLLATNGVYSWGESTYGQLGHGDVTAHASPRRIDSLSDGSTSVVQVAAGWQHSLALTSEGEVRSFGAGSLGRLGLGGTSNVHVPVPVIYTCLHGKNTGELPSPSPRRGRRISLGAGDGHTMPRIVRLTAGLFHSMAVTQDGELYTWGSGTNGRLGHGDTVMQLRPRRVDALADTAIVHASAGSGHSVAVSEGGALYTWGQGYAGRLGHGSQDSKPNPALVEALSRETVTTAVAGSEFTIALTSKGTAFAFGHGDMTGTVWWGRGWEGLWGRGTDRFLLPARLKSLEEDRVEEVAAGSTHTVLRTRQGALFTFGCGTQGQLVRAEGGATCPHRTREPPHPPCRAYAELASRVCECYQGHGELSESLLPKKVEAPELP